MSRPVEPSAAEPRQTQGDRSFRQLVERSADAILVLDARGAVRLCNPAAEELFQRGPGALLGECFGFPLVSGTRTEIEVVRSGSDVATAELRLVDVEWDGEPAWLASLRDVSEQKRAQQALDASRGEKLDLLDRLVSHVSHELRTPLTAIHEFVELTLDGVAGELNERQREFLEIAFRNVGQLRSLIDDLMDDSRGRDGKLRVKLEPLRLASLVTEVARGLTGSAASQDISLRSHVEPDLPTAMGDEMRIRQVLCNLLENAIKFTDAGGSITVSIARDREAPGFVRVSVADTGCGIAADALEQIFDRLFQKPTSGGQSRKGLGLGLHLCRELVHLQGGRIWAESKPGEGSTFHFTLPEYSLERIVAPAVTQDERLRDVYSLVRAELRPREPSDPVPEALAIRAHEILHTSIYPDLDVVLPRRRPDGARSCFHVVAGTGEEGMKSLVRRLKTRLGSDEELVRLRLQVEVNGTVERTPEASRSLSLDDGIRAVTQRIQELLEGSVSGGT